MTSTQLRVPVLVSCLLALGSGLAAGGARASQIPLQRQADVDSSFSGVTALAVGDIDRDGVLDLVAAAETAGDLAWWRGVSELGYFPRATIELSFDGAKAVALGDIDGDGDLDVVAAATTDMELAWWSNDNGDGTAWTKTSIITPSLELRSVAVADFDGDGDLDVAVAGGGRLGWIANTIGDGSAWSSVTVAATGTFGGARGIAVGDLDDDGDVDIAAVAETDHDVSWFESSSAGTVWTRHDLDLGFLDTNAVAIADIDGDGSLDVLAVSPTDNELVWWEVPAGTPHPVGSVVGASSLSVADLDRDGDLDVAVGGEDASAPFEHVVWFENTAGDASAFTKHPVDASFDQAYAVVASDLDQDGYIDLAGASFADDTVAWWSNDTVHGSALFRQRVPVMSFTGPASGLAAGDVDDDGDLDLVTGHLGGGVGLQPKAIWLENMGGAFGTFVAHDIDDDFGSISGWAVGDIDDDGDLDVVAAYGASLGRISWYPNDGTPASGLWTEQPIDGSIAMGLGSPDSVALADIDRNGTLDVVASLNGGDKIVWYSNDNGDGSSWTPNDIDAFFDGAGMVVVADLDGDGTSDVLAVSGTQSIASWWSNDDGDGSVWTERTINTPTGALSLSVADVDEDGDLDVYIGGSGATVTNCINGGGATTWACGTLDFVSPGTVNQLQIADLDGDGDADVASQIMSTNTGRMRWIDNRPVQNVKVDIDLGFAEGDGLAVADLDGDGDLDLAAVSNCGDGACSPVNELAVWENAGGQFSLATTDTAPTTIASSGADDVLAIDARHLGRDGFSFEPQDSDIELTSLELLFEETDADPLSSLEMNALIDRVEVWLDDEVAGTLGLFDGEDDLVTTVDAPFTLSAGVLSVAFLSGDAEVLLMPDSPTTSMMVENIRSYFVVIGLTADANGQTPSSFQVTHLTDASSTAQDAEALLPLRLEWAANVSTDTVAAGAIGPPDHLLIQNETITGIDTREACLTITADPDVVIQAGATVVFRTAEQVALGSGFVVESTATFRVEMSSPALCP